MKRGLIPAAAPPQVLRNVVLQQLPHALTRPRAPALVAPLPVRTSQRELDTEMDLPPAPAAPQQARDDAVARAYEQGRADGQAAACDEQARERDALLDEARRDAVDEGRRQGYEQGLVKAGGEAEQTAKRLASDAGAQLAERLRRLEALLAALPDQLRQRLDAAEDDMLALCHEVVCGMLGETAATPQGLRAQLNQARRQLGADVAVAAHLHPLDWACLNEAGGLDAPAGVQWVPDAEVKVGGLLLRTPQGSLDARLEQQMKSLQAVLLAARSRSAGAGGAPQEGAA